MISPLAGSLKGLRILDASRVLAGPYAGQILADLGAEVIKVEQPGTGDETRAWGPPFVTEGGLSAYFLACNRGKRSITIDLKKAEGRELFAKLAAASDVVLENFRGDSVRQMALTPTDLLKINPKLVVISISGFGRTGTSAKRPGYDFVVQGMSGMMAATGPVEGVPSKFGVAIADLVTGLYAVIAALAGVRARDEHGQGVAAELCLIDCAAATMANVAQAYLTSGKAPKRQGNAHMQIVPYQAFEASDGWFVLAVGNDAQFRRFCKAVGRDDLAAEAKFATNAARVRHREALVPMVAEILAQGTVSKWTKLMADVDVPAGPIWDLPTLFGSEVAKDRGLKITAKLADGTPVDLVGSPLVRDLVPAGPPTLGQDTEAVLKDVLGLDAAAVATLRNRGVV